MIALDTNVVLHIVAGTGRVGSHARQLLDDEPSRVCSTMVQWELAMLASKGKLDLNLPVLNWVENARSLLWFVDAPVTAQIALDAGSLAGSIHGDPCDRIMIATARALDCPLLTSDAKILAYAAAGHLQAIDASR